MNDYLIGGFVVINAETMEKIVSYNHRKQEISDIKFSPSNVTFLSLTIEK